MKHKRISDAWIRIVSLLTLACIVLGVSTAVYSKRAEGYRAELELTRQRTFTQLCENLDAINTALKKCAYSGTSDSMAELSDELSSNAAAAKLALAALECGDSETDGIYKFLSQVGAYTRAISTDEYDAKKNAENLLMLSDYSGKLYEGIATASEGYYEGTVSFEKAVSTLDLYTKSEESILFSDSFSDTEQALTDYPTLIYDGPFSDTEEQTEVRDLEGEREITKGEAREIAAKLLECEERQLRDEGDDSGTIHLYCFSGNDRSVGITKNGGKLCYMLCSGYAGAATISTEEAITRAKEYLDSIGYVNMKESYYSVYDGICTVNFAYSQGGVTVYPDLIKTGVSLDTGKVCTLDARGYLMNHCDRTLEKVKVTQEQAVERLNDSLRYSKPTLTLIPKNEQELLCYEFKCTDRRDNDALVYINAVTGREEQVLLLLYSDNGTLTK